MRTARLQLQRDWNRGPIWTNGQSLVEFFATQAGTLHVCLEEGTQAGWLVEILSPHGAEIVVAMVLDSRGQKSDKHDAFALAEQLRAGTIETPVYKPVATFATLRQLVKAHQMIVQDSVRVQNRIKALFRARGVRVAGSRIYSKTTRAETLRELPASRRAAAELLLEQYDALCQTASLARGKG